MPGIFAQTIAFASATVAIGVTDDMSKGIVDRFRSLPMARSAYLTGRTVSEIAYQGGILVVLMLTGLGVGWRVRGGLVDFLLGVGLLLLFTYAMAWIGVWLGQLVPTVEVAQQVSFTVVFPITFISNVIVPPDSLPAVLQPIAEWNPVSTLASATRDLWGNPNPYVSAEGFPAQHPALLTVIWMIVVIAVFAPLGVARYRRTSR
jgi:ABC transporter DrrB family efflux protein